MLRGEIISVGTELLLGQIVDTNARYLSEQLAACGVSVHWQVTVGDNLERVTQAFRTAMDRAELVIASGGLGPTSDDLTRQALACALGCKLVHSEEAWHQLQRFFLQRDRMPSEHDRRQALIVPGARILPNLRGTAPGLQVEGPAGHRIFLLPGPPNELIPMFEGQVLPSLAHNGMVILSRYVRMVGIPEAKLSERLDDLFASDNPTLAPYASSGELYVRITVRTEHVPSGVEELDKMEQRVSQRLAPYVYGRDQDTLEMVVGQLLREGRKTLSVAESCTGGRLASRLTGIAGSSDFFLLGIVAYSDESKRRDLGVSDALLAREGAVSADVARAMADGVRALAKSDYGVGITGIAGPTGGSLEKPVGLVYVAVAGGGGEVKEYRLTGDRGTIQERAAQQALVQLWQLLRDKEKNG